MDFCSNEEGDLEIGGCRVRSNDSCECVAIRYRKTGVAKLQRLLGVLVGVGRAFKERKIAFALQFNVLHGVAPKRRVKTQSYRELTSRPPLATNLLAGTLDSHGQR